MSLFTKLLPAWVGSGGLSKWNVASRLSSIDSKLTEILNWQKEIAKSMATQINEQSDAIQQFAAKVEANFTTLKTDLGTLKDGVAALNAKLVALQAGGISAIDTAALQALVDDSAALVKQAEAIQVTPPAPPAG